MTELRWLDAFGDNLREMLKDANMTQRELADAAYLSEASVSRYVNKQEIPGLRSVVNIAYALDCSVDELVDFGDMID